MTTNRLADGVGDAMQGSVRLLGLIVALGSLISLAMAETAPKKAYDCGDWKIEVSEPKDRVLQAHVEDFDVEISIRERQGTVGARFLVTVKGPKANPGTQTQTSARSVPEALDSACRIIARYYKSLEEPSGDDLAKQLNEFYDQL